MISPGDSPELSSAIYLYMCAYVSLNSSTFLRISVRKHSVLPTAGRFNASATHCCKTFAQRRDYSTSFNLKGTSSGSSGSCNLNVSISFFVSLCKIYVCRKLKPKAWWRAPRPNEAKDGAHAGNKASTPERWIRANEKVNGAVITGWDSDNWGGTICGKTTSRLISSGRGKGGPTCTRRGEIHPVNASACYSKHSNQLVLNQLCFSPDVQMWQNAKFETKVVVWSEFAWNKEIQLHHW